MYYIILYIILINLRPFFTGTGVGSLLKFLPNAILVLGMLHYSFMGRGKLFFPKIQAGSGFVIWFAFLGILIMSLARTAYPNATMIGLVNDSAAIILINLLVYIVIGYEMRGGKSFEVVLNEKSLHLLIAGGVLISMYLFVYIVGYNHPSATLQRKGELAVVLKLIGISYIKKNVPFTWGMHPNTISIISGGVFMATVIMYMFTYQRRQIRTLLLVIGIICLAFMLVGDSRGTFLMSFLAFAFVYTSTRFHMPGGLRAFVLLVPFLPFLMMALMQGLGSSGALEQVSRTGDAENISNLSARNIVWDECLKELKQIKPMHIIGWGEHGASPAGVSKRYKILFGGLEYDHDDDLIVTHNLFFQSFFDVGYLGTAIFLASMLMALNNGIFFYNKGYNQALFYIGFVLYYILSGTLESNFGNHNRHYNEILMIIVMGVVAFKNEFIRLQKLYESEQAEFYEYQ